MKRSFKNSSFWKLSVVMLALTVSVSACNDDDEFVPVGEDAYVGVLNLMKDGTDLDSHIDNKKINESALEYGEFSNYFSIKGGEKEIVFFESGQTDTLLKAEHDFKVEKTFSVFVLGDKENAETVIFSDEIGVPAAGKAKIRFANFVDNDSSYDLWVGDNEAAAVEGITYKNTKNFVEVDVASQVVLQVKAQGAEEVFAELEDVTFESNKLYTVYVIEEGVDGVVTPVLKVMQNVAFSHAD